MNFKRNTANRKKEKLDNITIGVEGYVGSGKTSMCEKLLDLIPNSILLHGGNLYRAIVYVFLKNNSKLKDIDLEKAEDKEKLATEVSNVDIEKLMEDEKIEIIADFLKEKCWRKM